MRKSNTNKMETAEKQKKKVMEGHPIHTVFRRDRFDSPITGRSKCHSSKEEFQKFYNVFNHLAMVETTF